MSEWPSRLVFTVLPCLVGAYAAAVFLTTRPLPASRAWSLGLLIASLLTVGASIAMRPLFSASTANSSILEWFVCLYFIPTIVLVATALALRSRDVGRGVGVTVLIALFLVSTWAAEQATFHLIGFINAVQ